ncbi:ABC transporter ATP-binding protein [Paenibacillus ihumii]|uniref:ABC transporter ATP-binding protein n=1 Tax=Paenibacillus ihumii TaxID=687436 RepID=UPI0006D81916|nr:ATP-binding cassette domain-containing protein [Paenibacillus ihumii]
MYQDRTLLQEAETTEPDWIAMIDNVTFTYPGAEAPVLNGVSLQIKRGDFVAVIGGNGSGKSTLCKTLNGLIPHYYVGDFEGSVQVNGLQTLEHDVARLSRHVGYVYQDFENQLIRPTVLDDASFAPLNYGFEDYLERGQRALRLVDLTADPKEFIWQLSGGQKHQLALAGAVSLDPDILIIDEPVAQLDPRHARDIYELLRRLNEQHGKTIIVIEHHTEFIAEYCKQVVLMDQGRAVWSKPVEEALLELEQLRSSQIYPPQVTQAAAELAKIQERDSAGMDDREPNLGCFGLGLPHLASYPITLDEAAAYFQRLQQLEPLEPQKERSGLIGIAAGHVADAGAVAIKEASGISSIKDASNIAAVSGANAATGKAGMAGEGANCPERRVTSGNTEANTDVNTDANTDVDMGINADANTDAAPIIEAKHVRFSYRTVSRERKVVLRDVSATFRTGDLVALVGNNGAGKSSFMRLITGVTKPESGRIVVKGMDTAATAPEQLANTVTYIYQNPEEMFIEDSIRKDVEFFLKARRVEGYKEKVDAILESFGLTELQHRDGRLLSGGQQRRASLAIGVAMNPSVILLDEPTANLDIATRKDITRLLKQLNRHVETVIVATHDMQLVAEWANRIIVMHQGDIIRDGTRESVFGDAGLLEQAGLRAPQILELSRRLGMSPLSYTVDEFAQRWNESRKGAARHGVCT